MSDWLQDLKPGDEVFVSYGLGCYLATVENITPRYVHTRDERFTRNGGLLVPSRNRWLMPITDEDCRGQVARQCLKDKITELRDVCYEIDDYRVLNNVSATLASLINGLKKRKTEDAK